MTRDPGALQRSAQLDLELVRPHIFGDREGCPVLESGLALRQHDLGVSNLEADLANAIAEREKPVQRPRPFSARDDGRQPAYVEGSGASLRTSSPPTASLKAPVRSPISTNLEACHSPTGASSIVVPRLSKINKPPRNPVKIRSSARKFEPLSSSSTESRR